MLNKKDEGQMRSSLLIKMGDARRKMGDGRQAWVADL